GRPPSAEESTIDDLQLVEPPTQAFESSNAEQGRQTAESVAAEAATEAQSEQGGILNRINEPRFRNTVESAMAAGRLANIVQNTTQPLGNTNEMLAQAHHHTAPITGSAVAGGKVGDVPENPLKGKLEKFAEHGQEQLTEGAAHLKLAEPPPQPPR